MASHPGQAAIHAGAVMDWGLILILILLLLVMGAAGGFAAGLLEIGGGMVLVPFLTPARESQGDSGTRKSATGRREPQARAGALPRASRR